MESAPLGRSNTKYMYLLLLFRPLLIYGISNTYFGMIGVKLLGVPFGYTSFRPLSIESENDRDTFPDAIPIS